MNQAPRNIGIGSLLKYRFPLTAISSILHRASGVILFLFIPFMLYLLHKSLASSDSFACVQHYFCSAPAKFFIWVMLSALIYHFIAGVRHLLMDMGLCEELQSGKISSIVVMVLSIILIVGLGVSLW